MTVLRPASAGFIFLRENENFTFLKVRENLFPFTIGTKSKAPLSNKINFRWAEAMAPEAMGGNNMAFKREFLKSVGLSEEQITAVMDAHTEVTDALKKQRDEYKADAEKLPEVQKQLDEMKGNEDYKAKYENEHKAYEDYKNQVKAEADQAKLKAAYRKLLADEQISEKRLDAIIRATDFSGMKLDKDGNLDKLDDLKKKIGEDWGDFKVTVKERGAHVDNPPKPDNGGNGANPRAAELAKRFYERRYGSPDNKE